jgi:XTP/dITP diphosphohydrolase
MACFTDLQLFALADPLSEISVQLRYNVSMKQVYLLTGNPGKIKAANYIFNKHNTEVLPLELDIPEIQAESSVEIATYMVKEAFRLTGKPAIREDHSFYIKELGFPGPFMAYADKTVSPEQLLSILDTLESRDAYFELGAAYIDKMGEIHKFSYQIPITMSDTVRGTDKLRWERLMMFPGGTKTFAEFTEDEDDPTIWSRNYEDIAQLIEK